MIPRRGYETMTAAVLCAVSLTAGAEPDAERRLFDDLYAADLERVAQTPATDDDVTLARHLLSAAEHDQRPRGVSLLLARHAADLAAPDDTGFETAVAALRRLITIDPDAAAAHRERLGELLLVRYRSARADDRVAAGRLLIDHLFTAADTASADGDADAATGHLRQALSVVRAIDPAAEPAVRARLDALRVRRAVYQRIAIVRRRLQTNPQDTAAATQLIRLYVVDLDNPAAAMRYGFLVDDALADRIRLASVDHEQISDHQAMTLGDWYASLVEHATTPLGRRNALDRARGYYALFLKLHPTDDLQRTRAALALKKLETSTAEPTEAAPAARSTCSCSSNRSATRSRATGRSWPTALRVPPVRTSARPCRSNRSATTGSRSTLNVQPAAAPSS